MSFEGFFDKRAGDIEAAEYLRVLGTQAIELNDRGLYDAGEFIDERAAIRSAAGNATNTARNVLSIMARKRGLPIVPDHDHPIQFRDGLLEDIEREIAIEREKLGD